MLKKFAKILIKNYFLKFKFLIIREAFGLFKNLYFSKVILN
jgi:hypothetical protein